MCTMGDTAHIDIIFKFLPHTRQHVDISMCAVSPMVHTSNTSNWEGSFPVAVKNSSKAGPLVFLRFVITENIMKRPVLQHIVFHQNSLSASQQ